jgi:hypothetical protein
MANRNIIGDKISSKFFTFSRADNRNDPTCWFTTEMSTLNGNGFNPLKRAWSDACDAGFVLVSDKTGNEAVFTLIDTVRDADGDVVKYVFAPVFSSVQRNRGLSNSTVNVYNT